MGLIIFKVEIELSQEKVEFSGDPSYTSGFAILAFEDGTARMA